MAKRHLPAQPVNQTSVYMLGSDIRAIAGEGEQPDSQELSEEYGIIKYRAVKTNDEAMSQYKPTPTDSRAMAREPGGRDIELILHRALKSPHLIQGPRKKMLLGELQSWAFQERKMRRLAPLSRQRVLRFEPRSQELSSLSLYRQIKETNPRLEQLLGFRQLRPSRNYHAVRSTQIAADGYDQIEKEGVLKSEQVNKVAEYAAAVQPEAPLFTPMKRRLRDHNSLKLVNAHPDDYAQKPQPNNPKGRKTADAELLLLAAHVARFPVPFAA